ncbi:class F sortase [Kribbella sp. NPDC051952]|uniref:class F sortase n=1 Tax=Kribbella sp. NPDC051952 TaxID=3154851 RepID=UPI003441E90B
MIRLRGAAIAVMAALTVAGLLTGCGSTPDERTGPAARTLGPTPTSAEPRAPSAPPLPRTHAAAPTTAAAASTPSRMRIDAVNLDLPVLAVGVATDGQMALPPDPARIGWYQYGPGPRDAAGSVVLGGHVDSKEFGTGPLVRLRKVRAGDRIVLRSTDGSAATYRVQTVKDVRKSSLALGEVFDRDGPRQLRIVTCGGPYDRNGGGYRDNLVVTATPVR